MAGVAMVRLGEPRAHPPVSGAAQQRPLRPGLAPSQAAGR
jgi:hypothetical protein